jgi:hypothetical protein
MGYVLNLQRLSTRRPEEAAPNCSTMNTSYISTLLCIG